MKAPPALELGLHTQWVLSKHRVCQISTSTHFPPLELAERLQEIAERKKWAVGDWHQGIAA